MLVENNMNTVTPPNAKAKAKPLPTRASTQLDSFDGVARQELLKATDELKAAQGALSAAMREMTALKSELSASQNQLQAATRDNAVLKERILKAEQELKTKAKDLESLSRDHLRATARASTLETQLDQLHQKVERAPKPAKFSDEVAALTAQLAAANNKASSLAADLKASEALLRAKEKDLDRALADAGRAREVARGVGAVESRLKEAVVEASDARGGARRMEGNLSSLQKEVARLGREVTERDERDRKAFAVRQELEGSLRLERDRSASLAKELDLVKAELARKTALAASAVKYEVSSVHDEGTVPASRYIEETRFLRAEIDRLKGLLGQRDGRLNAYSQLRVQMQQRAELLESLLVGRGLKVPKRATAKKADTDGMAAAFQGLGLQSPAPAPPGQLASHHLSDLSSVSDPMGAEAGDLEGEGRSGEEAFFSPRSLSDSFATAAEGGGEDAGASTSALRMPEVPPAVAAELERELLRSRGAIADLEASLQFKDLELDRARRAIEILESARSSDRKTGAVSARSTQGQASEAVDRLKKDLEAAAARERQLKQEVERLKLKGAGAAKAASGSRIPGPPPNN